MSRHWSDVIVRLGACPEAVEWARTQPSAAVAWRTCQRSAWLTWVVDVTAGAPGTGTVADRKRALLAAALARTALQFVPAGEGRPLRAIEMRERWARREEGVTWDDVTRAAWAAGAAWAAEAAEAAWATQAGIVRQHYPRPPRMPRRVRA